MDLAKHLHQQAQRTHSNPTEGQKRAGNYLKGRVKAHGLPIVIENANGSIRRGTDADGKSWQCRLPAHYGYIRKTEGADGDHVDVYVGPHLNSRKVFVLDQNDAKTGEFDEHKVWFGFNSPQHVLATYRKAFSDGKADKRFGHLKQMTPDEFRAWLKDGDTTQPIKRAAGGRVGYDAGGALPRVYIPTNEAEENARLLPEFDADPRSLGQRIMGEFKPQQPERPEAPADDRSAFQRLTGQFGERFQTWPEKVARSGATLPGDVLSGEVPQWERDPRTGEFHTSNTMIERAQDTAGMAGGTSFGALDTSAATLGAGPVRRAAAPKEYPMAPRSEWHGEANFETTGGRMGTMTPDEFLAEARPLKIDEVSRENIDILKQHMLDGKTLDPLQLYPGGKEDGRHRAIAAKELGIKEVPVINFRSDSAVPGAPLAALEHAPRFFSGVERAVEAIQQPKMTGDQWLGTLSNKPGVKPEELQWTGLADFLTGKKGQPVTKQEVMDHIAGNKVELQEVMKGQSDFQPKAEALAREHGWESWDALGATDQRRYMQRAARESGMDPEAIGSPTKYEKYQLPGGENYREMLMTLPSRNKSAREYFADNLRDHGMDEALRLREQGPPSSPDYRSGHWDEPNILAHMRMNDRTMHVPFTPEEAAAAQAHQAAKAQLDGIRAQQSDVAREIAETVKPLEKARRAQIIAENKAGRLSNGDAMRALEEYYPHPEILPLQEKLTALRGQESELRASLPPEPQPKTARSLHLEEIQSDWHQQGRDKGYRTPYKGRGIEEIDRDLDAVQAKHNPPETADASNYWDSAPELKQQYDALMQERLAAQNSRDGHGVPDAPFKKNWHELALKRALREAAEKGYDRLSWTPGEAQAARYDLSKQVDKINLVPSDGRLRIDAFKNNEKVIEHFAKDESEVASVIGKEAAKKLLENRNQHGAATLAGQDLKIGGEGMKGFYDSIIPKALEKIGKEHGVKVRQDTLPSHKYNVVPGYKGKWDVVTQDGTGVQQFGSRTEAEAFVKERGSKVHYIDIPQSLRDAATQKGFALFEDSAAAGAPLAAVGGARPDWMRDILTKSEQRKAMAADLAVDGKAVRLAHADGRGAMAGPDMSKDGAFRLTRFDADGPAGHTEHQTLKDAVLEGLKNGYGPTIMEDSAFAGAPLSAIEHMNQPFFKENVIRKKGEGIPTGKSAKGHTFKRPEPAKGSFAQHAAKARADWNADKSGILADFSEATNSLMKPEDWDFMRSGNYRASGGSVPHMAEGGGLMSDEDMGVQAPVMSDADMGVTAKPDAGALSAAGRGAFQGATFNFGDEISGARAAAPKWVPEVVGPIPARTIAGGARLAWDALTGRDPDATKAYDETVAREREANKLAAEQHPWAYHGAEVAGAIPGTVALPGGLAARGATLANRIRQGATLGAEAGALAGAGEGEDAASRLTGAGIGTGVGAVGGSAAAPVTEGIGLVLKKTLGPVWNAVVGAARGSENEAARRITNAIQLDAEDIAAGKMQGMTLPQWQAARAAGEPVTLAEMGGTRTQALLRSATNTSPEGRGAAEKVITERFEGQADRVGQDVRNLVNGGANANKTADQLVAEYDVARVPAYRHAFSRPGAASMWDDDFAQMAQAPVVQQAIRMASVNAKNEAAKLGLKPPVNPFRFEKDGTVNLTDQNFKPNLQFWDVVKKNLDQMGADGNAWSKVLRGKLDDAVPEYSNARGIAAQFFGERDALEAGRKLAGKRVDPQQVGALMRKMSPEEKDLFREGHASDWAGRVIGSFRDSRDITKAMFNSPNERKMAEVIYGPAGVKKLEARMTLEAVMDGARRALGNSTTARQLIEAGLAGGAIGGYLEGDWKGAVAGAGAAAGARKAIATEALAGARNLIGKVDAKTAARVAELLTSDDPTKLAAGMRIMVSNKRVADGMRAIADRMNIAAQSQAPRVRIDTTGWSGAVPVRADQDQPQP